MPPQNRRRQGQDQQPDSRKKEDTKQVSIIEEFRGAAAVFKEIGDDLERWVKWLAPFVLAWAILSVPRAQRTARLVALAGRDNLYLWQQWFSERGGPASAFFARHRVHTQRFRTWAHDYRVARNAEHAQLRRRNILAELFTTRFTRL